MINSEEMNDLENIILDNDKEENIESSNESNKEIKKDDISDKYEFGWSVYSEITNGRFAMLGFLAIILIEFFSQQSFLKWAGIL